MEEKRKAAGRPRIYDGESSGYGRELEYRRKMRAEAQRKAAAQQVKEEKQEEGQTESQKVRQPGQREARQAEPQKVRQPERREAKRGEMRQKSAAPQKDQDSKKAAGRKQRTPLGDSERLKPLRDKLEKGSDSIRRSAESVTGSNRRREQENARKMQVLIVALGVLTVLLIAAIIYEIVLGYGTKETGRERMAAREKNSQIIEVYPSDGSGAEDGNAGGGTSSGNGVSDKNDPGSSGSDTGNGSGDHDPGSSGSDTGNESDNYGSGDGSTESSVAASPETLQVAQLKATQYDYDGAMELLKGTEGYAENAEYQAAVSKFEEQKAACVPYPAAEVTHIFFHTLIHDASKAFDGDEYENGYNQFMVTEYEFNSIIQQMYERGYVMVFIDELAPGTDDGNGGRTFATRDIMLPPDKIPFVLSQDDVSYYHYMDGDGFASRLIVDENGDVKNEYIEDDGSVSVGDYDMVPLIDRFVEEHPDFSYHGEKGYIALTGYEGILGYRTDEVYKTKEDGRVTIQQQMFFDSYPGGFNEAAFEKECEEAKKVAEALKSNGWKFASHTWGHQNLSEVNGVASDKFKRDTDRWETWVEPLIGETDTLIYAFGGDIRDANKYSGERFDYLKQCGFDYFCGVDSAKHWLQVEPNYVRQSRRNIDGYRMYYNPDMLSDLFDVSRAWDPLRPATVPEI